MIKFSVQQWDKNKNLLESDIRANFAEYNRISYKELVQKVVRFIFNDSDEETYDVDAVAEIDNGDYQGTLLYLVPENNYQPAAHNYLMTTVDYGSCSGCDTLQSIQGFAYDDVPFDENEVSEYMDLCRHLVQKTIKPYNNGWAADELFEPVEMSSEDEK